jgi:hypothetical protein
MDRNTVFYAWQRAQLFEVGDDEQRAGWLLAAIADLVATLRDKPHEVRCYTLVALDEHIEASNRRLADTYELVKKHWTNVEGRYTDPPVTILRGVILSALYELGTQLPLLRRVIYYTASGYAQFVTFGSEQPVINQLLDEFGRLMEAEAARQWTLDKSPAAPEFDEFELPDSEVDGIETDTEALKKKLEAAANNGVNVYNDPATWSSRFSAAASAAIALAIDTAVGNATEALAPEMLTVAVNTYFSGVSSSLGRAFEDSFQALRAVEQRSRLLWWKEALYSTSLRCGYRQLDPPVLPVVLAMDLANLLPNVTPVSVDFLLLDAYRTLTGEQDPAQSLGELLAQVEEAPVRQLLRAHLPLQRDCGERTSLTGFILQVVHEERSASQLTARTGLRADQAITGAELAVLVLHDLLTERLATA